MFNAVELVLMLMSMFSLVNLENRRAVWFLFEISLSYDLNTGQFRMTHRSYDAFLQLFGPLSALASYRGMVCDEISNPSVMEAHGMICAILKPILERLSADELQETHDSAEEGLQLLFLDLPKFELIVKTWIRDARDDGRFARWTDLDAASTSTASPSPTPSVDAPLAELDSSLARARAMLTTCWTPNITMDERIAASILSYCASYAAASTQVSIRRVKRVKPRKTTTSDSIVLSTTPPTSTIHRRNRVKTHKPHTSHSADDFVPARVSLQRTSRVKTRRIQSSVSSTDGESIISSPVTRRTTLPISSSAPQLGASSMTGLAFAQHPYLLRRAASILVLSLGDDQFDTSFSPSSSSTSVAWGIGCSPAELAAEGYMDERLVDASLASRASNDWADYGRSSSSLEHDIFVSNDQSPDFMPPAMPETPLKRRRSISTSGFFASPRPHSPDCGFDVDYPRLDSPILQRSSSFMEPPPTPLKRGVSCSFDSFKSMRSATCYPSLGVDHAGADTSQRYSNIILASSETSLVELNSHEGHREAEWEMMTPSVAPVRALPAPVRVLKRKRAMRDLRAHWVFPHLNSSLEPCASRTMYATKVVADSRPCVGGFVCDAWWTTPGLSGASYSPRPTLLAPTVASTSGTTPYHMLDSQSLLAPSTASLCPRSPGTSILSTPLQTPRSSAEDLPFVEWANEWEADQHSLWSSALVDEARQFSEEMIKPPKMNAAVKLTIGVRRRIASLGSH